MSFDIPHGAEDNGDPFLYNIGDLGFSIDDLPVLPFDREIPAFVQSSLKETKEACTIVNAWRQFCHTANIPFRVEEMLKIIKYCVDNGGYVIGSGWETAKAMKYVNKYIQEFYPSFNVIYAVIQLGEDLSKIISKGYCIGFTYKGNSKWNEQRKDGILEGDKYQPRTYGHRTIFKKDRGIMVDDSSTIKNYIIEKFGDLVKNGNIYPNFYVWILKSTNNADEIKKLNKWNVILQKHIEDNNLLLNDPVYKTTDVSFRTKLMQENIDKQKKLDKDILPALKKIGL